MSRRQTEPIAELYRAYHYQLLAFASLWTRNRADAKDAVHDAFEYALGAYATIQPDNPRAWMYALTRYRAIDTRHHHNRDVPAGDAIQRTPQPPTEPAPTDPNTPTMANPHTALYVLAALDELGPLERQAVRLWALEELSWQQVAEHMGITPASVKRGTQRSLQKLRGD